MYALRHRTTGKLHAKRFARYIDAFNYRPRLRNAEYWTIVEV